MRKLVFDTEGWKELGGFGEQGYPKEVCGLLFGKVENSIRKVLKIVILENILDGKHQNRLKQLADAGVVILPKDRVYRGGTYEFLIDPQEHYQKVREAEKNGLDQIGLFHSHPDHPAIPSAVDSSQPFLSDWSNLILAVAEGKFSMARSWFREKEDAAFQEENILVE